MQRDPRPDPEPVGIPNLALITALLAALVLSFYLLTLQPSLAWGDGARMQLEAYTGESFILGESAREGHQFDGYPFSKLGVAAWDHPLYVMLGRTATRLMPGAPPAYLINLISAIFGAATILVVFHLALGHTASLSASLIAALSVAVSHTFWFHSVTPEVYTLFSFLMMSSLFLFDHYQRTGRGLFLTGSAFLLGLGAANHLLALLALPAMLLYALLSRGELRAGSLKPGQPLALGLAFLAGFSPYLIQLFRMLRIFPLEQALGPAIGSVFVGAVTSTSPSDLIAGTAKFVAFAAMQFSPLGLTVGIVGFARGREVSVDLWRKMVAFYVVYTAFGIMYRVTDQFAFFLASHVLFGLAIAMGVAGLRRRLHVSGRRALSVALICGILLMPVIYAALPKGMRSLGYGDKALGIPQVGAGVRDGLSYYLNPNKRGDMQAYRFAEAFFLNAPSDALLIAEWYTDTDELFVMRYYSRVESQRPDIQIIGWPLQNPFHFNSQIAVQLVDEQVSRRPIFLASLSQEIYAASDLLARYCVVPELNMYRIYPFGPTDGVSRGLTCLSV